MDILSHGLWGAIAFGRTSLRNWWWAFLFGVLPDLLSFGIFTGSTVLGLASGPDWEAGPPPMEVIPAYVHVLYDATHSLVVFAAALGLVWLVRRKIWWPMFAWPLHILVDIPTHSTQFFATPFLWPLSEVRFDGIPWSNPWIFIPNVTLLVVAYALWFYRRRARR